MSIVIIAFEELTLTETLNNQPQAVVFSKDVKRAADATKSVTSESKYELHEFVQLL